jgi:hypothetical protein
MPGEKRPDRGWKNQPDIYPNAGKSVTPFFLKKVSYLMMSNTKEKRDGHICLIFLMAEFKTVILAEF